MSPLWIYILIIALIIPCMMTENDLYISRQLLQETFMPTSAPTEYVMDCCERTSGLYYESIDCYDDNTPIILSTAQNYLFTPDNFCTHPTNCDYSSQSITESESNLCLIAWALLQQYYNKCPQLVMGTTNIEKTHFDLSPANTFTTTDVIDYDSAPKLINPLVYKTFIDNENCMQCNGEYLSDGNTECNGLCDFDVNMECGVCELVVCLDTGSVGDDEYEEGTLEIWERALLLASVVVLGCICCWGILYLCCNGSNRMNRGFNNQNMQLVNGRDPDSD